MNPSENCSDEYLSEKSSIEESDYEESSTSGLRSKFYNVESSAPKKTLHGLTYQLRLLMLFVQRVPDGQEFYLSTEMHEAGYFDDVVLQYRKDGIWRYRFLQAKHHVDDKLKIKISDLFHKSQSPLSKSAEKKKPYLLKKYFKSYCKIEKDSKFGNAKLEEFLICTNVGFGKKAMTYFKYTEEDEDPILLNFVDINKKRKNPVKYKLRKKHISKLKKECEINWENKYVFRNFVKKFRFLTNYDDHLHENIQSCLKEFLEIENVALAYVYLQNRVLKWFASYKDKKSKYLKIKDKKKFLESLNNTIESLLVAGYSTFYIEELKSYKVQFKDTLPLCEFIDKKTHKIICIITASPKLSTIKLSQLFNELKLKQDEFIFTNGDQLNYNKKIFSTFFSVPSYKWLVIECHNEIKLSRKILNKIEKMDNEKKIVIIGWEDNVLNLNKCLGLNTPCFDDKNILFKDLTIHSQEKILEKQVIFQGEKVTLNELIDINSGSKVIDGLTLEILLVKSIKIGNNDALISDFPIENCYIRRKLIQKKLSHDILHNVEVLKNSLFIISDVNRDQLKDLNICNEWIFLWEDSKTFINGIILPTTINSRDIFNKLSKNYMKTICWLEYTEGNFLIRNIRNETDILKYICLEEHDLQNKLILEKPILIVADGPGCGKSIFLTRVAHHLKQIKSDIWVLRFNLSSYAYTQEGQTQVMKSLKDIDFINNKTDRAIKFMVDLLFPQEYKNQNNYFVRELLTQSLDCLNANMKFPKIILLFDGFDEISPLFKEKTLTLLQALQNSKVAQMWITTRNHEELSLEEALKSYSFFLKPLDFTEKVDFLEKLWKYNLMNFDNIKPKPESKGVLNYLTEITNNICKCDDDLISDSFWGFQKYLLPTPSNCELQHLLSKINFSTIAGHLIYYFEYNYKDKISDFTGNPLQLKMIAEIIFFKKFSSLDKLDIFSLYKEFIKYKWTVFRDDKKAAGKSVAGRSSFKTYLEYLATCHQNIAFKSLFCSYDNKEVKEDCDKIELSRVGLLVIHNDRLEFIHRSFAEYFVSEYFAKYFKQKKIQKIVFSEVLVGENHSFIRKFLNSNTKFLDQLSSKTIKMIKIIRINCSGSKILYQMLEEDLCNLFIKFLENLPLDFSKNPILFNRNVDGKTALHRICEYINDEQIVENILKAIKDNVSLETLIKLFFKMDNKQRTALHCINFDQKNSIVVKKLQFFKLSCPSKLFYELLLQVDEEGQTILHIACRNGLDITYIFEVPDENRDVISKLLLKTDNNGQTALYNTISCSNNPSLLTKLLNLVKSVCNSKEIKYLFRIKNDSRNLLHTACSRLDGNSLGTFLNAIRHEKEVFQQFLLDTDKDGLSPLHSAVLCCSDLDKILDFVKLNCGIEMLHTVLCQRTYYGATILHIAVKTFEVIGDDSSLRSFLTYLFNLVKNSKEIFDELLLTRDHEGQTVLHYSSLESPLLLKELLNFVQINCSANILGELILKLDDNGANILHFVCRQNNENCLNFLLNKIKDNSELLNELLLQTDSKGSNALYYTVFNSDGSSVMRALLNFVKINCEKEIFKSLLCEANNEGLNVLHVACMSINGKRECEDHLISLLKFIEDNSTIQDELLLKTSCCGCIPLHYTVYFFDNPSLLKILFDFVKRYAPQILDALLLKDGNKGRSLLHFACERSNEESLKYLLSAIQDRVPILDELILKADNNGQTILHYSVHNFEMLNLLLDFVKKNCREEETFTKLILKCDNDDRTGLHTLCQTSYNEEILTYLLNFVRDNTNLAILNTFLFKKDSHGKIASDYVLGARRSCIVFLNYTNFLLNK